MKVLFLVKGVTQIHTLDINLGVGHKVQLKKNKRVPLRATRDAVEFICLMPH